MSGPIYPEHGKVHETKQMKEIYSRELDSAKNATEMVWSESQEDVPNYQAYLQSAKRFDHKVTRTPHNKSAGKADHAAEKAIFKNRAYMTLIAPHTQGKTPF